MRAANLYVHNMSSCRGFRKIIIRKIIIIRKWSYEAELNFEFYLDDWHLRLTLITAVLISTLPVMEINHRLLYWVVKNIDRGNKHCFQIYIVCRPLSITWNYASYWMVKIDWSFLRRSGIHEMNFWYFDTYCGHACIKRKP